MDLNGWDGSTGGRYDSSGGSYGSTCGSYGSTGGSFGSTGGGHGSTTSSYESTDGSYDSTGVSTSLCEKKITKVRPSGLLAKLGLPCQVVEEYQYDQCYSYYANGCYNTCQFVQLGDMEDFMNHERRKEKSRDAARSRRSRETEIFTDLATALPLANDQVSLLDKASIMRLAISYLKVREMISLVPDLADVKTKKDTDGSVFLKSLDGFIVVLSVDGDFIYLSENVCDYLGLSQIDLMGQNIFEYSHPCDHEEIRETLSNKTKEGDEGPKSMFIRMKCTLTSKGRSVNLKSAIYKVIQCKGHMTKHPKLDENCNDDDKASLQSCFMAVGQPIAHPSNIEVPLPKQAFLTKHGMDMKFTHADDDLLQEILGYDADDLVGKSVYDYHHAMDSEAILSAYKCLFSKGQCETTRYRFLAKTGGYVWVLTQATLIYDKAHKPQSVVCVNYVISGRECKDEIYSCAQYASLVKSEAESSANSSVAPEDDALKKDETQIDIITESKPISTTAKLFGDLRDVEDCSLRPQSATSKIFGPRTKDMSKGFLTFSDEEPGLTMLKDEPEDLTHLAPVAGDVCVPLDEHPFLSDMLDDILLRDNFGPLLTEEPSDPFISYRDFQDTSPQLLSPNLSKQSDCSLPSLNSPSDSLIDEDQMSTFMNLQMEDDPDLVLKAPYIPMNVTDDLPLLVSNDLMWSNNVDKKAEKNSSLAQLLSNNKHVLKVNDHGGGLLEMRGADEDMYCNKSSHKSWTDTKNTKNSIINNKAQTLKRPNSLSYDQSSKRTRSEPKENISSELLHQLMSNNTSRGRSKGKGNWLLESGGQKAACISQPSDSVLMNLLDDPMTSPRLSPAPDPLEHRLRSQQALALERKRLIRKHSISLLDPEGASLASLADLTQHDCEVNAPAGGCGLLQGLEILTALDVPVRI